MSASVKRTVLRVVAAMLMAAFSTFFAITFARLIRQHHSDAAADDPEPTASAQSSD
jgi:hypothetical protein